MNSDEYNKKEEIVDVPYYTRDLCKDNKFRFARRLIRCLLYTSDAADE